MANVLIVDDEQPICSILENVIQAEGHECVTANNADEAKAALGQRAFDLVTLDIVMPGESGLDLLAYIHSAYRDTAVVMITSMDDPETAKQAVETGAYGYISKPFEREEVIINVHNALRRGELEAMSREYQNELEKAITLRTKELAESESNYRDLVQSVNSVIMRTDQQGRITFFNDYGERLLGYSADELLGRPVVDLIARKAESSRKIWDERIESLTKFPDDHSYIETENIRKDGERIWMAWTNRLIHYDRESGFEVLSVGTDITDHKRAEEAVKQSEMQLRLILDSIAAGIVIIDPETHGVSDLNTAASRMIGLPKEEIIGRECHGFITPAERGACPYLDLGEELIHKERTLISADGTDIPILKTIHPVTLGGKPYLLETHTDITALKQAENELRESEEQYRTVVETMREGLILFNKEYKLEFFNTRYAEMLGYTREELPSVPMNQILDNDAVRIMKQQRSLMEKGVDEAYELTFTKKNGDKMIAMIHPVSLFDDEGNFQRRLSVIVDITEKKMMEQQLLQAQKLESIGQLAAGVAHEINTPAQYIHTNLEFLQEACGTLLTIEGALEEIIEAAKRGEPLDELLRKSELNMREAEVDFLTEEVPDSIKGALDGVERISRIVDSMKYFSHPGEKNRKPIDVNDAILNAVTVSTNEWKYSANVVTDLDDTIAPLPCFAAEFSQVLLNIIVNAAHAISDSLGENPEQKGTISISTRQDADWIEICIGDTGSGIPEKIRSRIFDPFFTTKDVGKGTGQGLSIAHSVIVEQHGGTIDFETERGRGTTFILRLPLEPVQTADE